MIAQLMKKAKTFLTILMVAVVFVACTPSTSINNNDSNSGFTMYSDDLLAKADEGAVVLFFSASWCPTCRSLKKNLNENLDSIPEDLVILELDYDTELELKQKYGVLVQHTLVQVDSGGNKIKMWTGGNTLQTIIDRIT